MKIVYGLVAVAILVAAGPSAASDAERAKEAEKLLTTMASQELLDQTIEGMVEMQVLQDPGLTPFKQVLLDFFSKHMSYETLKPELIEMYADAFSATELREINAFYETDAGRKAIEKMPELAVQSGQLGVARVQANLPQLSKMIEAERVRQLGQP